MSIKECLEYGGVYQETHPWKWEFWTSVVWNQKPKWKKKGDNITEIRQNQDLRRKENKERGEGGRVEADGGRNA